VSDAGPSLAEQNVELRRRLNDAHAHYRRQLDTCQDQQQTQALLVQKLQAQVTWHTSLSLAHLLA